jgi:phage terminase small subunit
VHSRSIKPLTLKQELFCLQWFKHKGNGTRAYAAVYGVKPSVARANAARALASASVADAIDRTRKAMAKRAQDITLDSLIADLDNIKSAAMADGNHGPAVSAVTIQAKLTGLLVERKEVGKAHDFDHMSDDELRRFIAGDKRTDAEVAAQANVAASANDVVGSNSDAVSLASLPAASESKN